MQEKASLRASGVEGKRVRRVACAGRTFKTTEVLITSPVPPSLSPPLVPLLFPSPSPSSPLLPLLLLPHPPPSPALACLLLQLPCPPWRLLHRR